MQQLTTPTTWPNAKRNAAVIAANIRCQALGCERQGTRWSNVCGLCEKKWLEDHKPVFGKPTPHQLKIAQQVIRQHYRQQIDNRVFDDWASQIGRSLSRPEGKLVSPLGSAGTGRLKNASHRCWPCGQGIEECSPGWT